AIRRPAPAFAPPTYRPTGHQTILRAVGSRLLLLVGLLGAAVAMLGLVTGQDPLLTFGFKTPQFVAYQGASAGNVRFTLNDGWSQRAVVPGGMLMAWREGQVEPTVMLTLGNPAAEPEIERLGTDGSRIEEIRYRGSWPGVDTVLKAMPGGFSSNMIVEPGVDP